MAQFALNLDEQIATLEKQLRALTLGCAQPLSDLELLLRSQAADEQHH